MQRCIEYQNRRDRLRQPRTGVVERNDLDRSEISLHTRLASRSRLGWISRCVDFRRWGRLFFVFCSLFKATPTVLWQFPAVLQENGRSRLSFFIRGRLSLDFVHKILNNIRAWSENTRVDFDIAFESPAIARTFSQFKLVHIAISARFGNI